MVPYGCRQLPACACYCGDIHSSRQLSWGCHGVLQPCNPAVGGPAKSQLVHEVDALGGEMGKMADRCYLQKRVLNRSKARPLLAGQADGQSSFTGPISVGAGVGVADMHVSCPSVHACTAVRAGKERASCWVMLEQGCQDQL